MFLIFHYKKCIYLGYVVELVGKKKFTLPNVCTSDKVSSFYTTMFILKFPDFDRNENKDC